MFFADHCRYFSTFATVDPTRPDPTKRMGQPNPWTTPILHRGVLAAVERALVGRRVRQNGRATPHACPR